MRVISKKTLIAFWQTHKDSEQALKAWYDEAMKANWQTPNEIKMQNATKQVKNHPVIFLTKNTSTPPQLRCALYRGRGRIASCNALAFVLKILSFPSNL
jgi:hypothetical protein